MPTKRLRAQPGGPVFRDLPRRRPPARPPTSSCLERILRIQRGQAHIQIFKTQRPPVPKSALRKRHSGALRPRAEKGCRQHRARRDGGQVKVASKHLGRSGRRAIRRTQSRCGPETEIARGRRAFGRPLELLFGRFAKPGQGRGAGLHADTGRPPCRATRPPVDVQPLGPVGEEQEQEVRQKKTTWINVLNRWS